MKRGIKVPLLGHFKDFLVLFFGLWAGGYYYNPR